MKLCITIILLVSAASLFSFLFVGTLHSESSIDEIHHQWMIKYGRTYANTSEMEKRKRIFQENLEFIKKKNKVNKAAGKNYTLDIHYYSDLTIDELTSGCIQNVDVPNQLVSYSKTGFFNMSIDEILSNLELVSSTTVFFNMSIDEIPKSVDWREEGAVTNVKRQGNCGASWAFGTMAALEGLWQIKTGELISLSAQHVIDCDPKSRGCKGGVYSSSFKFETAENRRVPSEENYPYKESRQTCRDNFGASAGFDGFGTVPRDDEHQLLQAVVHQPIATQIAASQEMYAFRGSEIYSGDCGECLNHEVAIVGYGVTDDGKKYWIIKNSWGEEWADSGYMKLIRDAGIPGGYCGIHSGLSYFPILNS